MITAQRGSHPPARTCFVKKWPNVVIPAWGHGGMGAHRRVGMMDVCNFSSCWTTYSASVSPVTGPVGVPVLRWTEIYKRFEFRGYLQEITY